MKNIYLSTLLLGATLLIGCGEGSTGKSTKESTQRASNTQVEDTKEPQAQSLIHTYKVVATPTSGGSCKGAEGEMVIEKSKVSGTIKTGWGDVLTISGTYDQSSGDVDGGFAKNNNRLAEYSGNITDNNGGGTWSDSLGCSGTWETTNHSSKATTSPQPSSNTSTSTNTKATKVNAHEIQGYQITYPEDGLTTVVTFECDGTYTSATSNHGINIPIDSGKVQIRDTTSDKAGVLSFSYMQVSLDDQNNVVAGESKAVDVLDDIHTITSITKVSECN